MEYLPGVCAGISQTLVGHPFDTVKTRIQNGQLWQHMGIRGYYRGVAPPLAGSTLFIGLLFPVYRALDVLLCQQHWLSGAITGVALSPIVHALDAMKILQQTSADPMSYLRYTHGLRTTAIKEAFATSIYFSVYDICREHGCPILLAGSMTGFAACTATYPLDVIRTRQVAQCIRMDTAMLQGNLYQGIGIASTRAILVNGAMFYTYDAMKSLVALRSERSYM